MCCNIYNEYFVYDLENFLKLFYKFEEKFYVVLICLGKINK